MPFLVVSYFCQTCAWTGGVEGLLMYNAVDKGTLASSSVMGIQPDNHLHGQQYSLLGTILYSGIIIGELPVNRLIQRVRVAKLLGCLVICWVGFR